MKYLRKSVMVNAEQYIKGNDWPDGVKVDGYIPATGQFERLHIALANGQKMEVHDTDWVVTIEAGDQFVYTDEQFKVLFELPVIVPEELPKKPELKFGPDNNAVLYLNNEGLLVFQGGYKKSAEHLFNHVQKTLIDPYIAKMVEEFSDEELIKRITNIIVGKKYNMGRSARHLCSCCDKKGAGELVILREGNKSVRRHLCDRCIVGLLMIVKRTKENK